MTPFIGQIQAFAFGFTPEGWISCAGQYLSPSSYPSLFSLIGTTYGGDGRTTFALPDLRGRVPLNQGQGAGLSNHIIGTRSGMELNYLSVSQMPSHNHAAVGTMYTAMTATTNNPANAYPAPLSGRTSSGGLTINGWGTPAAGSAASEGVNVVVGYNGGNQPINNMQPFLTVNYCIAVVGIYPSRATAELEAELVTGGKPPKEAKTKTKKK